MDYSAMDFWWKVFITLMNMGIGVYLFWERHNDGTARRVEAIATGTDTRLDDHSARLAKAEARLEQLPDHDDLGDLHERINELSSGMNTMTGELSGVKTTLNLIHQHLLSGGRGAAHAHLRQHAARRADAAAQILGVRLWCGQ